METDERFKQRVNKLTRRADMWERISYGLIILSIILIIILLCL
ncbi:hypothetical protein B620_gp32 [Croceibacter phage P2559S]|nr:hypothetical protein B620_gp32 [Croceibacter phage P2559S]AFM54810.1 hypothetical protein P2559S_32 [Croceibacter phage P2559S]